ncbi:Hypothetical protein FKW44_018019, partial [Caligus rogercresseyi]
MRDHFSRILSSSWPPHMEIYSLLSGTRARTQVIRYPDSLYKGNNISNTGVCSELLWDRQKKVAELRQQLKDTRILVL